jgi:hypothetical protein
MTGGEFDAFLTLYTYSKDSAMPENIAENNFPKVMSVLPSHRSESLQVILNEIISMRFLVSGDISFGETNS